MAISEILKDQRQELDQTIEKLTLVSREVEMNFNTSSRLIQVVSGVRRCGKSVLIYKLLADKHFGYVNFDDDRLVKVEPNEILGGLHQVYGPQLNILFLDEIQNLDNWELFVNRLHRAGFKLFLTGSNAKLLAKEMATHLTGRHLTLELFPFSFREFLESKNFQEDVGTTKGRSQVTEYLNEYLRIGGFPEVVLGKEQTQLYLRKLHSAIIERDIVSRYNITYKKTLKEIAGSIASNPARFISYGKIRRQFGLGSDHTVKNYLSYLEEAYLVIFINKFSFKPVEIETSEKKVYSIDPGMIAAMSTQQSEDRGRIYENVVALELLRQTIQLGNEIYYWKNQQQEEVDFVIREHRKVVQLIQVCYDPKEEVVRKRELHALLKASKELKCQKLLMITENKECEEIVEWFGNTRKVIFIPLWKWLLQCHQ